MTTKTDITLPPLPLALNSPLIAGHAQNYARAAVEADRKQHFENGEALQRYKECGGDGESDPLERLRFYCSLAMSGQDWLDVEPFFDALVADRQGRMPSDDLDGDEEYRDVHEEIMGRADYMLSDDDLEEFAAHYADEMGCIHDDTHAEMIRAALLRFGSGQPAASAEPCKTCGGSGWIGGPSYYDPGEGGEPCSDCVAPVAQEQVGYGVFWREGGQRCSVLKSSEDEAIGAAVNMRIPGASIEPVFRRAAPVAQGLVGGHPLLRLQRE